MTSLFILSLPRSLSSFLYHRIRATLNAQEPSWTTDGELLNNDRFVFYQGKREDESLKFTEQEKAPEDFARMLSFLEEASVASNYVYKDVIQPFVMTHWLATKDYPVLKIKRSLTDITYSLLKKKWHYPERAARMQTTSTAKIIEGLWRARQAIDRIDGPSIHFDEIIQEESYLQDALRQLYPQQNLPLVHYLDDHFCRNRFLYLKRRETDQYQELQELVQKVQAQLVE